MLLLLTMYSLLGIYLARRAPTRRKLLLTVFLPLGILFCLNSKNNTDAPHQCTRSNPIFSDKKICLLYYTIEGPKTVLQSLSSYEMSGLFQLVDTKHFFLLEDNNDEYDVFRKWLALRYGFIVQTVSKNDTLKAISKAVSFCREDFLLTVNEDSTIIRGIVVMNALEDAMAVIDSGAVQGVRLDHSISVAPKVTCLQSHPVYGFWNFSSSPAMLYHTSWFKNNILKGHESTWAVATSSLFSHARLDRGRNVTSFKHNLLACYAANFSRSDVVSLANAFMSKTTLLDDLVVFVDELDPFRDVQSELLRPGSFYLVNIREFSFHSPFSYVGIRHWLLNNKYSGTVILSKARNIIFRKTPFPNYRSSDRLFIYEDNRSYHDTLDPCRLGELINKNVISDGLTVGSFGAVIVYLDHMINFLNESSHECAASSRVEHAAHINIFFRHLSYPYPFTIVPVGVGPIMILGKRRNREPLVFPSNIDENRISMIQLLEESKSDLLAMKMSQENEVNNLLASWARTVTPFFSLRKNWVDKRFSDFVKQQKADRNYSMFSLPHPTQVADKLLVVYTISSVRDGNFFDQQLLMYVDACEKGFEVHVVVATISADLISNIPKSRYFCRRISANIPVVTAKIPGNDLLLSYYRYIFLAFSSRYDYFLVQEADVLVSSVNLEYYRRTNSQFMAKPYFFYDDGVKKTILLLPGFSDFEVPVHLHTSFNIRYREMRMWLYVEPFSLYLFNGKFYIAPTITRHRFSIMTRNLVLKLAGTRQWFEDEAGNFNEPNVHYHARFLARHGIELIPVAHFLESLTHHGSNKYAHMTPPVNTPFESLKNHNYQADVREFLTLVEWLVSCEKNSPIECTSMIYSSKVYGWTLSISIRGRKNGMLDRSCVMQGKMLNIHVELHGPPPIHVSTTNVTVKTSKCVHLENFCQVPEKCKDNSKSCHSNDTWTKPGAQCFHP